MIKRLLFLLLLCCAAFAPRASAQLFNEDFNFPVGDSLTQHGYLVSSGGTTNAIRVDTPGLAYPGYVSSGIGNAAFIHVTGQDVYKAFPADSIGNIYLSFMMKVDSAKTGDYFIALSPSSAQFNYFARFHVKASAPGYVIGLSKNNEVSGGAVYGSTVLGFDTTYLVVVKYQFVAGGDSNDVISAYVFASPADPSTEPATPEIGPYSFATRADAPDLGFVNLRQGSNTAAPGVMVDGIRVGATWAGTVLGLPVASLSTTTLALGAVQLGSSKTDTVTVTNVGGGTLDITSVTSSNTLFTVTPSTASLAALASQNFAVSFTPLATGAQASTIVFTSNAGALYDTVTATGEGAEAGFSVEPKSIAFGLVYTDSSKSDTVLVKNASTSLSLVIDSVVSSNGVFTVVPPSATVPASDSMEFAITFHPVAAGAQTGRFVFYHNGPSLHDTVTVSGNSVAKVPVFTPNKTTVAIAGVFQGNSRRDSVTVRNAGYDSLFITSVTPTDTQFTVTPTAARLDTGKSAKFYVTYRPNIPGSVTAYLQFADNTPKGLDSVRLTGGGALTVMPIADARMDTNHDGRPDRLNQTVVVEGIVNSVNIQTSNFGYFMQDSTAGIQVFQYGLTGAPALRPGFRIRVTGAIAYYRGTTEVSPSSLANDIVILDTGHAVTAVPLTIGEFKADPERYESMRIRLPMVMPAGFSSADWPAIGDSPNLNIWDGKDTLILRLDSDTEIPGSAYPNFPVALYGIASQFTSSSSVTNDGYQITPMFNSDFVPVNTPPLASFHLISPLNGSRVTLDSAAQVVSFSWNPATDYNANDTLRYTLDPIGFTAVPSGGNSLFVSVDLTGTQLLAYLGSADSTHLRWTVRVSDGVNPAVTSADTATVTIVRGTIAGVGDGAGIPKVFALDQNFPNPFNPSTTIHYALPRASRVVLKIYSLLGGEVATLVDEVQPASYRSIVWKGKNGAGAQVASGVYFYRLIAQPVDKGGATFTQVKKMLLLK